MRQEERESARTKVILYVLSLAIVAWGQPARIGWLGAAAAAVGFSLFFRSLPIALSSKQRFYAGLSWFGTVQLLQLSWMTSIEYQGYYILFLYGLVALAMGAQFGWLTALLPGQGKIPIGKVMMLASLWTLMEWGRLQVMCGFSWNPVGLSLTHFIPSLQFASVFGVLGLSFWVMATNLLALNLWRVRSGTVAWMAFAAFPYLFGLCQLNFLDPSTETRRLDVALIQTDWLPPEKNHRISPLQQWQRILALLKEKKRKHWDLIVLPEAAVPMPSEACYFPYDNKKVSNLFLCQSLANFYGAEVIAGLDHMDRESKKNFNSAFYFSAGGQTFERYDKQILLPLAEYLPFEGLRGLTRSYGITDFFSQGTSVKIFGGKNHFSPSICYEETFSETMRQSRMQGAQLFVNMTNDNYFPDSLLHSQHLFHARVRAVENGIPLIRACNAGITAAIDSFGRILAKLESGEGVLEYSLNPFRFSTLFSYWGDGGIVSLSLVFLIYALRRRIRLEQKLTT